MRNPFCLEKYPPPVFVRPDGRSPVVGRESFELLPVGFFNSPVCSDSVFPLLDSRDVMRVRCDRLRWSVWLARERAINAPFLAMAREANA